MEEEDSNKITTPSLSIDEEGEEVTAPTPMDGWHVNYLGDLPEGWKTYEVYPELPKRIFAN